ncbi:MAG: sulfatase-like hydrolase/transferase [Phycisphaerales bacterium]|nr:sulfatase-like hydrolase/transferase [Phycisphaerales bacterium]
MRWWKQSDRRRDAARRLGSAADAVGLIERRSSRALVKRLVVVLIACVTISSKVAAAQPPVLLVTASELAEGTPLANTPHLDDLRRTGLVFGVAYAMSPVGSPSQAGLLSGRHPMSLGIPDEIEYMEVTHLRMGTPTLASMLASRGYWTSVFGAWRVTGMFDSFPRQPDPEHLGFDHWLCTLGDPQPSTRDTDNLVLNGDPLDPIEGPLESYLAGEAAAWIASRKPDEPWFCAVHLEGTASAAMPERVAEILAAHEGLERDMAAQMARLEQFDEALGVLLDAAGPDALVVMTALHGPHDMSGGRRVSRGAVSERGLRVPCVIRHSTIEPGTRTTPVWGIDVMPTIASITGSPRPEGIEGESMLDASPDRVMLWHFHRATDEARIAARRGQWVIMGMIRGGPSGPYDEALESHLRRAPITRTMLYDLDADPMQTTDCGADHPDLKIELTRLLRDRFDTWRATFPSWD